MGSLFFITLSVITIIAQVMKTFFNKLIDKGLFWTIMIIKSLIEETSAKITSWYHHRIDLNALEASEIEFEDLPEPVKTKYVELLFKPYNIKEGSRKNTELICLGNEQCQYELENRSWGYWSRSIETYITINGVAFKHVDGWGEECEPFIYYEKQLYFFNLRHQLDLALDEKGEVEFARYGVWNLRHIMDRKN